MSSAVASLIIYTYTSFVSPWGAGPAIQKKFEAKHKEKVRFVSVGDSGLMLSKLKLEGVKSQAHLLLGLDAAHLGQLKKIPTWGNAQLEVFDSAPLAFIYDSRRIKEAPSSFEDLLEPKWKGKIAIEDPRLSTTGLNFLFWLLKLKGEDGTRVYLKKLKKNVDHVLPDWDLAYGLFKKGKVDLVLSYWTSPAYHIQEEKLQFYKAAKFKEGHYVQKEYVALRKTKIAADVISTANAGASLQLFNFLLSQEAQEVLPEKNFMYPAMKEAKLTPAFAQLETASTLSALDQEIIDNKIESWLTLWKEVFTE